MLNRLYERIFHAERISRKKAFDEIMGIAQMITDENPADLHRLIRALILPVQAEHMISVAERSHGQASSEINRYKFFFEFWGVLELSKYWVQPTPNIEIDLSRDVVLPTPWNRRGYAAALTTIGEGKTNGPWTQDPNHAVSLWLPWRIGFVSGGNHSITAGILGGEGSVQVDEVFDLNPVLRAVECDGTHYRNRKSGDCIAEVEDHRRAAVFEIGRLLPPT